MIRKTSKRSKFNIIFRYFFFETIRNWNQILSTGYLHRALLLILLKKLSTSYSIFKTRHVLLVFQFSVLLLGLGFLSCFADKWLLHFLPGCHHKQNPEAKTKSWETNCEEQNRESDRWTKKFRFLKWWRQKWPQKGGNRRAVNRTRWAVILTILTYRVGESAFIENIDRYVRLEER